MENAAVTAIFLCFAICSFHTIGNGSSTIQKSRQKLIAAATSSARPMLPQVPPIDLFQVNSSGTQSRNDVVMLHMNKKTTMPQVVYETYLNQVVVNISI
jgi:hypothetical protein